LTSPDAAWQQARERFAAIAPLLDRIPARKDVELRSLEIGRHPATLYRWIHLWRSGLTLYLLGEPRILTRMRATAGWPQCID
jgi:hypothetical protein